MKLTIEEFKEWIESADCFQTLDTPILHSVNFDVQGTDPDEEVLLIDWHDADGEEYAIRATRAAIENGDFNLETNTFKFYDNDGEDVDLLAFKMIAHSPGAFTKLKDALTIVMDLAADNILEDDHVADDPEVLQEQQDSQNAAYETVQRFMKAI